MNSFDTHVHIDEFAANATPAELAELNAWVHEDAQEAPESPQEVDPSGGYVEDYSDYPDDQEWDYPQEDNLYGCDPQDSGGW